MKLLLENRKYRFGPGANIKIIALFFFHILDITETSKPTIDANFNKYTLNKRNSDLYWILD